MATEGCPTPRDPHSFSPFIGVFPQRSQDEIVWLDDFLPTEGTTDPHPNPTQPTPSSSVIGAAPQAEQIAQGDGMELMQVGADSLKHFDYWAKVLTNQNEQTNQDKHLLLTMKALRSHIQQHQQTTHRLQDILNHLLIEIESGKRRLPQVRDDLSSTQLQPLQDLLNCFPRLLQQLAAADHKKVELILSGAQILVDKAIAERLYEPLFHLVRNAFDHGIESPEIRYIRGKSEVGRIEIQAYQRGGQVIIAVQDDGQGIDLQKVVQRAIELNIVTPDQVEAMSESQLLDLLFKPGFSTADPPSELFGRGVGLDIVKRQIQTMQGSIGINSTIQEGTTFYVRIPLSIDIAKRLGCQTHESAYALSVEPVEQSVVPQSNQISLAQPFSRLGFTPTPARFSPPLAPEVSLAPPKLQSLNQVSAATIMVVDDSVTLRQILSQTLKQVGYKIRQAEDGLDALTQLQQHSPSDLIISNIETARLDGYQFLHRLQQYPALVKIPVICLTSRHSKKHRQLAVDLGAAAYFTKPYNTNELLATVHHLLQGASA